METLLHFFTRLLHIDNFLGSFIQQYGAWVYALLFIVIFCETGFVILPFLPGDSLLFVSGAFCMTGTIHLPTLILLLSLAAILGNTLNYLLGHIIGPKLLRSNWRWIDRTAFLRTHHFYQRHGGKAIVIARFIPVVRTFAPFVAGVCEMALARFQLFNLLGALLWVLSLVVAGYFLGNLPFVKQYLNVVVLVGISVATLPVLINGIWKLARQKTQKAQKARPTNTNTRS